jgi:hypothetical protein
MKIFFFPSFSLDIFIYRRSGIIQSYLKKNEKKKFREKRN